MNYNTKVALKIKELRSEKGYKAESLAKELEMSTSSYSQMENGNVEITLSKIEKIIQFYKISINDLLPEICTPSTVFNNSKIDTSIINGSQVNNYCNHEITDALRESISKIEQVISKVRT